MTREQVPTIAALWTELLRVREDVNRLVGIIEAQKYADHLKAIDDMAAKAAGMTRVERNYFDHKGKNVPAALIRVSDWWRKFRTRHGFLIAP